MTPLFSECSDNSGGVIICVAGFGPMCPKSEGWKEGEVITLRGLEHKVGVRVRSEFIKKYIQ